MNLLMVDIQNTYFATKKKSNRKVDYCKLMEMLNSKFGSIDIKHAFVPINDKSYPFIGALNRLGFAIDIFERNANVGITIKTLELLWNEKKRLLDGTINFIILSNNYELIPLYKELRDFGVRIHIITSLPSVTLCNFGACIELPEEVLGETFEQE